MELLVFWFVCYAIIALDLGYCSDVWETYSIDSRIFTGVVLFVFAPIAVFFSIYDFGKVIRKHVDKSKDENDE